MAGRIEKRERDRYPMAMRTVLLRCLVVLAALAFVGGALWNARTQSDVIGRRTFSNHDARTQGESEKTVPSIIKFTRCLCCCLGCASLASRAPDDGVVAVSAIVTMAERINA